jgi:hypothetical protein
VIQCCNELRADLSTLDDINVASEVLKDKGFKFIGPVKPVTILSWISAALFAPTNKGDAALIAALRALIDIEGKAKKLKELLDECPPREALEQILEINGLKREKPPLRSERGKLNALEKTWTETDHTAEHSALFTTSGIWTSRRLPIMCYGIGLLNVALLVDQLVDVVEASKRNRFSGCIDDSEYTDDIV